MIGARFGDDVLEHARELGAATLHEAAGRRGAMPSRIGQVTPGLSLAGRALTVLCPVLDNLWLHRAVVAAEPGDVLVVSVSGGFEGGYWGEVLSHAAMARGLGGLVIDGGVRDSAQLIDIGLPVFAERICMRGTGKDKADGFGGIGQALVFDDLVVRTGDLVVGDEDGVAVFPPECVPELIEASQARVDKEADFIKRLHDGATTLDLMGLH